MLKKPYLACTSAVLPRVCRTDSGLDLWATLYSLSTTFSKASRRLMTSFMATRCSLRSALTRTLGMAGRGGFVGMLRFLSLTPSAATIPTLCATWTDA
jgi:hypothetical protein